MNKTNLILVVFIVLMAGAFGGYSFGSMSSGGHDEIFLRETAEHMQDDSKMMNEMARMMKESGIMMEELGAKYNDMKLTGEGKVMAVKSAGLLEESEKMMNTGVKMMEMME